MACRDGVLNEAVLSNIFLPPVANFGQIFLVNILTFEVFFLARARIFEDRLHFPFVQPQILMCSFGWCKYELPEFFLEKVMGVLNFHPW